jgi:hypothetical protein
MGNEAPLRHSPWLARSLWIKVAAALTIGAVVLGSAFAYLLSQALEDRPALTVDAIPRKENIPLPLDLKERIKGGTLGHGQEKRFILNTADLNTICRSALNRRKLSGQCYAELTQDSLIAEITLLLPGRLAGKYLNISVLAQGTDQKTFHIANLRVGALRTSSKWALFLIQKALLISPLRRYEMLRERLIRDLHVSDSRLFIVVNWDRTLLSELGGLITDAADKKRMKVYLEHLAHTLDDGTQNRFVRLGALTHTMFELARSRSQQNDEPVEENRAVIMVLSAYANGKDLHEVVDSPIRPARRNVLLTKRIDTAKHFLAAAVLSMSGQSTLVEMVGLAKELQDTHDGSGFSFVDLAADEAGALFGKNAISSKNRARQVQEILSRSDEETQFIPPLRDLPESLNPEEFVQKFSAIGSPEYESVRTEIRKRILALPIYQ